MISKDLTKRIITSIPLIFLLVFSFINSFVLIISLIIVSLISWIEFNELISKIYIQNNYKNKFYKVVINFLILIYLTIFSLLIFIGITQDNFKLPIFFLFCICIFSDLGGLIFGKIFKGRKLTKISPNKTISGSIGSFILSLILVPIFQPYFNIHFSNSYDLILLAIFTSFYSQIGDLFISFCKRKAKVKDAGYILPGHGGILDRIDGMLVAVPLGMATWEFLVVIV
ncbi:phosphatidate cytidylyltransferase [Candidatus Pelagibacter communis]|uniref:phosphatidate cytidylyltransferase n=1 Tax=Pelagibacter ubique TaxID=198252 RepID=UPI000A9CF261|nr:phosphatidate cytidylyltransferase [Candidatus Pelagibacter ubique]